MISLMKRLLVTLSFIVLAAISGQALLVSYDTARAAVSCSDGSTQASNTCPAGTTPVVRCSDGTTVQGNAPCPTATTSPSADFKGNPCGGTVTVGIDVGCTGKDNPIYDYVRGIVKFATVIFGILAVLMIVVTGIQYITSSGNPTAVASAKKRLVNVIISIVLYFLMVGILGYLIPGGIV